MQGRTVRAWVAAVAVGAWMVSAGPERAVAQAQIVVAGPMVGGPAFRGGREIGRQSVDRYASLLGLDEGQREMLAALHEGYEAAVRGARDRMRAQIREIQSAMQEGGDPSAWEGIGEAQRGLADRMRDLERGFFEDLRALLSEEQAGRWERVERQRRREVWLRGGALRGEGVDLLELARQVGIDGEPSAEVGEVLEGYELAMDRALQEKARLLSEVDDEMASAPMVFDMDRFGRMLEVAREAGERVVEVNGSYVRRLMAVVGEERRAALERAYLQAQYPEVYRPTHAGRCLEAAAGFADLTSEQREALEELRGTYQRELSAVNERHRAAVDEADASRQGGTLVAGGATIQMEVWDESDDSPLARVRKEKRDLDERVRERLERILTPEQAQRLPKQEDDGRGRTLRIEGIGEPVMIQRGG